MDKYWRDGYIHIKKLIDNQTIDTIINELYENHPENKNEKRIPDAWKKVDSIGYLAFNTKVLNLLKTLYNRVPNPFQTLNFYKGTQQKIHSDQIHFCSMPENLMCGVWIALEDISPEAGPLMYYPGSHTLPFYTMQKLNLQPGDYSAYENKMQEIVDKSLIRPEYALIKKGDIFIWQANLLHGGSKIDDNNLTRKSMVVHYLFEDCNYWTPLHSTPTNIVYRNPHDFIDKHFTVECRDIIYVKKYKETYSDLSNLTDEEAINHYYNYGIFEGRIF